MVLVATQVSSVDGRAPSEIFGKVWARFLEVVAINAAMATIKQLPTAQRTGFCFFTPNCLQHIPPAIHARMRSTLLIRSIERSCPKCSLLFEIALVLVRLHHIARRIVNADHRIM